MREKLHISEKAQDVLIAAVLLLLIAVATVPAQTPPSRQLSLADILIALRSKKADIGEKNKILVEAVKERGITFSLTPEIEKELASTGAATDLVAAIRDKNSAPAALQTPVKTTPEEVKPVEDFAFFRNRASNEVKDGKPDAAIADLEKAIALDPKDAGARHDHALLLAGRNDLDVAAAEYSKAAELSPQDTRNFIGRADVYERMGKPSEALADYQKVLSLNPADKDAAAAVVRISSAMTKAAMDLAAKQQPPTQPAGQQQLTIEKKADPDPSTTAVAKDTNTVARTDPPKPQASDTANAEPSGPFNAGNLMPYCSDPIKPIYPSTAMALRTTGDVTVSVTLDADGHVVDAKATSGSSILRAAAETAAKRSKFKPVSKNGKPVAATGTMSYTFKL
ncbi:MAG: TonB family protein [Acidobacteria bacterium]|nr:TonB family protein [Acidobacteriota bacterium]